MNWNDYYRYWDEFVRNWLRNGAHPGNDKISKAFLDMGVFDFNEMPDPYFGTPDKGVEAVFLNINPGGSQTGKGKTNLEASKYYSLRGNGAWLLDTFEQEYDATYSSYINDFSCLGDKAKKSIGTDREVCGASWWFGTERREGRLAWLNRFYRNFFKRDIDPRKVFAPEFCPFHSRTASFGIDTLLDAGIQKDWFKDHVITPAAEAARAAKIPVVGIGQMIYDFLGRLGYSPVQEWSEQSGLPGWPTTPYRKGTKKGQEHLVNRTYSLFEIDGANFLIIMAPGSNRPPSREFAGIESAHICPKLK